MEQIDLIKILNGDIQWINQVNVRDVGEFEKNDVVVEPRHVKNMLLSFLNKKITADELNHWAEFICLRTEYVSVDSRIKPSDPRYREIGDYYEDMRYVIQKVSTPEIDGEITEERVRTYLQELSKYNELDDWKFFKK